jgi:hypothetical protein
MPGVAIGGARHRHQASTPLAEWLKLAVQKIVDEALAAEAAVATRRPCQRTSPEQLAALAPINAARAKQ